MAAQNKTMDGDVKQKRHGDNNKQPVRPTTTTTTTIQRKNIQ
jgi:hypothetical protein